MDDSSAWQALATSIREIYKLYREFLIGKRIFLFNWSLSFVLFVVLIVLVLRVPRVAS